MVEPTLPEDCSVYDCGNFAPSYFDYLTVNTGSCGGVIPTTSILTASFVSSDIDPENPDLTLVIWEGTDVYGSVYTIEDRFDFVNGRTACPDGGDGTFDLLNHTIKVINSCGEEQTLVFDWPSVEC